MKNILNIFGPTLLVSSLMTAPIQAQDEVLRLGIGIFGHVIGQAMQQGQTTPAPKPVASRSQSAPVAMPKAVPLNGLPPARPETIQVAMVEDDGVDPYITDAPFIFADHNGSLMRVILGEHGVINIFYEEPRESLQQIGVTPGTNLFHGGTYRGLLVGTAYAFKQGCDPAPYVVDGEITDAQSLVLYGPGPVRDGCDVAELTESSPHSRLEFTFRQGALSSLLPAVVPAEIEIEPLPEPVVEPIIVEPVSAPIPEPVTPPIIEEEAEKPVIIEPEWIEPAPATPIAEPVVEADEIEVVEPIVEEVPIPAPLSLDIDF